MAPADTEKYFDADSLGNLTPKIQDASRQVSKYVGRYVDLKTDRLDWDTFKNSIDNFVGTKLTFDKASKDNINQSKATVDEMVNKIAELLLGAFSILVDKSRLQAKIKSTFTDLKIKKDGGFLSFHQDKTASNSSWEYKIMFSNPPSADSKYFSTLVTTITLKAEVLEETWWWGLSGSSSNNFSATIQAMQLVVHEDFTA